MQTATPSSGCRCPENILFVCCMCGNLYFRTFIFAVIQRSDFIWNEVKPIFQEFPAYSDGTSENLFHKGLCLPSGSNLTEADLKRVVAAITTNF